jgi:hypothetical protein
MQMRRANKAARAAWIAALAAAPLGCGGADEIPPDRAAEIPVYNASSDNKLKDVTLKNEFQHKDKIGAVPPPH